MKGQWKAPLLMVTLGMVTGCATAYPEPAEPPLPTAEVRTPEEPTVTRPDVEKPTVMPPQDPTPELRKMENLIKAPTYTPYTVRPDIVNRAEVARALEQAYPESLREEGIGGTAQVWFFIDAEGVVQRLQINESSGRQEIDDAALKVAGIFEFTPGLNRDEPVPVWISLPITFTTR